jgi:hypothetical protein
MRNGHAGKIITDLLLYEKFREMVQENGAITQHITNFSVLYSSISVKY